MTVHLANALEGLKKSLLSFASSVEAQVRLALSAFEERDLEKAKQVIANDHPLDEQEIDLEEQCLQVLALYQPVALDLRFVICALKIANDLERIGDLAVNIAERTIAVAALPLEQSTLPYQQMAEMVIKMLNDSLESFVKKDTELAVKVVEFDEQVDDIHRSNYGLVEKLVREQPENAATLIQYMAFSRYFERVADLATNIAEDVLYLVKGRIIRRVEH